MGLFKPAWQSNDKNKRIKAVAKITDDEVIKRLARADPEPDVRKEAVAKIRDKELLVAIALNDSDRSVKLRALRKLRLAEMDTPENIIKLCKSIQEQINKTDGYIAGNAFIEDACKQLCPQNAPISEIEQWASVSAGWGQHLKSSRGIHRKHTDAKLNPDTMEYE